MIQIEEATRLLEETAVRLPAEQVDLERSLGRVLAEDVEADRDLPPTDRSAMDGFAARSSDLVSPGTELEIVGEVRAGQSAEGIAVDRGQAVRIMTGGIVPSGADCVVMVEMTREDLDKGAVVIEETPPAGQHVRRRGEDVRQGDRIIEQGVTIRPAEIAAMASVGKVRPAVYRRPSVAVVSTGDEVVDPASVPAAHQIRNSNGIAVASGLAMLGIEARQLGNVVDDREALAERLKSGLESDILVVTGGVSVGKYDMVGEVLANLGMRLLFHKVRMKPGKPILAGIAGDCLVIGLPGNPVSAFAGLALFVAPVLRKLSGRSTWRNETATAQAAEPFRHHGNRTTFNLARLATERGICRAYPVRTSGSGDVVSMAGANGFLITDPESGSPQAGDTREAIWWRDALSP